MSITPRVTRRLYERMQLAPDVKRRTSVPKFDGATPGPDPSGAQPPKYPPSLPSLAPRPLPPLARHHFYPILPSHEFASRISANFPRPNPDNRRGSRRVSNRGIFILEYRRYLYNGRGYNRCVFETRNLAYIYIYISLCLSGLSVFYANVQKRVRKKNRSSEDCSAIVTMLKLSRGRLVFFLLLLLHPFLSHFLSFPSLSFAVAHGRISMRDVAGFPSRNSLIPVFE